MYNETIQGACSLLLATVLAMASYLFIAFVISSTISGINSSGIILSYVGKNMTEFPERSFRKGVDVSDRINHLKLSNNSIMTVYGYAFSKYINLRLLHLDGNNLTNFSPGAFKGPGISILDLSGNKLSCIPDLSDLRNSLKYLYISINRLHKCATGHLYSTKFKRLGLIHLAENQLIQLTAMTILWNAPKLTFVNLKDNELKQIPNFLLILPKLKTFYLEGNPFVCSCKIKWLKQIKHDGLKMVCSFDPIWTRRWDTLTYLELGNHCKPLTTWTLGTQQNATLTMDSTSALINIRSMDGDIVPHTSIATVLDTSVSFQLGK